MRFFFSIIFLYCALCIENFLMPLGNFFYQHPTDIMMGLGPSILLGFM